MKRSIRSTSAFSILELLVVISIMTIVILIAVPSFQSLTYSMRRSSAENSLKGGLRAARMVAIEAGDGVDAAAVFIHEPGGRITIIPCIYVGELLDQRPGSRSPLVRAQIFAPVAGVDAVQLPKGWSVRAYAPPNSIATRGTGWYRSNNRSNYPPARGNWIFPETGEHVYKEPQRRLAKADVGDNRQTFMVRYHGGSGEVDLSTVEPVLVLSTVPSMERNGIFKDNRADLAINKARFVQSVLEDDEKYSFKDRRDLLGNRSTDTVLARAVGQLAVFSESRLAGGVGARRLNRDTETLYKNTGKPELDLSLFGSGASAQSISEDVSDWLESRLASSDAMVFTIQRYSGRAQEMVPLEPNTRGTR